MWRNKQDCLWILNEPEVLFSFLAGAVAVPLVTSSVYDLTFNSGFWKLHYSHFHIPLHLWGLNSHRMVSIPKWITLPTIGCPHAYFISGKSISAVEEICSSASVQKMVIEQESQASSDHFPHESLPALDGICWTSLKLTVYKLLGIKHLKQSKGNSKCY